MNLVLCGFMGCGKTTVGKVLAERLGRTFIDTDAQIAAEQNTTVSAIFDQKGEAYFRDLEYAMCQTLAQKDNLVISTGGGALTFQRNVEAIKQNGIIILLDVPFQQLVRRVGGDANRPLFRDVNKAQTLYEKRSPLYRAAADYVVDGSLSVEQVAEQVCAILTGM